MRTVPSTSVVHSCAFQVLLQVVIWAWLPAISESPAFATAMHHTPDEEAAELMVFVPSSIVVGTGAAAAAGLASWRGATRAPVSSVTATHSRRPRGWRR